LTLTDAVFIMDDMKMKIVGRRQDGPLLEEIRGLQKLSNQLAGKALIPRGVYRFKSFKEADTWMINEMARTHVRLNSKTS